MSNVIIFRSKYIRNVEEINNEFIDFCKYKLSVFGKDLNWESSVWKGITTFRKLNTGRGVMREEFTLDSQFIDFAKSYIRYTYGLSSVNNHSKKMMALKCVEQALLQVTNTGYIFLVTEKILDEAMLIARDIYKDDVLHICGYEIERLARFLCNYKLINKGFLSWANPTKPNKKFNYKPEQEDLDRKNKLPDDKALFAIAKIFSRPDKELSNRDLFTTSILALLACSPNRVSEVLALPADCEIYKKDKNGIERYGLRFFSAKGFGANIKWIPDVMIPVAQKAIGRLQRLSENSRALARWYESTPDRFFRHSQCPEVDEDQPLTSIQVCQALGFTFNTEKECSAKLRRTSLDGGESFLSAEDGYYSLSSLWKIIKLSLPPDFPWYDKDKSIRYSNALCLLNRDQYRQGRSAILHDFYKPIPDALYQDIANPQNTNSHIIRIFERYGFKNDDGDALFLRSHQLRHLLNTIAHSGEMTELDLAKWSGRVSIAQNRNYNHVSQEEMMEKIKSLRLGNNHYCNNDLNTIQDCSTFIDDKAFTDGASHITAEGFCQHDYTMKPCDKLMQYISSKHYNMDNIKIREQLIKNITKLKEQSRIAMDNGSFGSDKWVQYHEAVLKKLEGH
jgi:hypothetical protein